MNRKNLNFIFIFIVIIIILVLVLCFLFYKEKQKKDKINTQVYAYNKSVYKRHYTPIVTAKPIKKKTIKVHRKETKKPETISSAINKIEYHDENDTSATTKEIINLEPLIAHCKTPYFDISFNARKWNYFISDDLEFLKQVAVPKLRLSNITQFQNLKNPETSLLLIVFQNNDVTDFNSKAPDMLNKYLRELFYGYRLKQIKVSDMQDKKIVFAEIAYDNSKYNKYIFLSKDNFIYAFIMIGSTKLLKSFLIKYALPGVVYFSNYKN